MRYAGSCVRKCIHSAFLFTLAYGRKTTPKVGYDAWGFSSGDMEKGWNCDINKSSIVHNQDVSYGVIFIGTTFELKQLSVIDWRVAVVRSHATAFSTKECVQHKLLSDFEAFEEKKAKPHVFGWQWEKNWKTTELFYGVSPSAWFIHNAQWKYI